MRQYFSLALILLVAGCASTTTSNVTPVAATNENTSTSELIKAADSAFENRLDPAALTKSLELYEQALSRDGAHVHALDRLVAGYYLKGYIYTEQDSAKIAVHDRGRKFRLKRLELDPGYREVMARKGSFRDAVAKVSAPTMTHALAFTAANWGWWAEKKGLTSVAFEIPNIKALFERALELDPGYYCSGPRTMAAAYYAKAGAFGGDMKKSKEFFDASVRDPACLDNRVNYARFWAIPMDDKELFRKLLTEVMAAPEDPKSEMRAENAFAKKTAAKMLAEEESLF